MEAGKARKASTMCSDTGLEMRLGDQISGTVGEVKVLKTCLLF